MQLTITDNVLPSFRGVFAMNCAITAILRICPNEGRQKTKEF